MYKIYCRLYQKGLKIAACFLKWREPELIQGKNSILQLSGYLKKHQISRVLVVTDRQILVIGLMDSMLRDFKEKNIRAVIYDKTVPNPTIENIEEGLRLYHKEKCEAIIAFGGGSPMDCAKGVGARVARPKKTVSQMRGILKVRKKLPTLIAVPTTAGTGSEVTLAAVVCNPKTHEKYAINDPVLIPFAAVMDPVLTEKLPPSITSTTGMDALTHAVEAYIGGSNTKRTKKMGIKATRLIMKNLKKAYENGNDLKARKAMQRASHYAGIAFTRAYVGYVHAVAHTLGGFYSIPHGLANAVILPYVLEAYGKSVHRPLAELYDVSRLSYGAEGKKEKAESFIRHIRIMNREMNIPETLPGIRKSDVDVMVDRAYREANPTYPVPRIMTKQELKNIYYLIMEDEQ